MPELRLYDYAASANCYKVRLLLGQLGREYERVAIDIFGGDTLTDEYARINPFRSTPVGAKRRVRPCAGPPRLLALGSAAAESP